MLMRPLMPSLWSSIAGFGLGAVADLDEVNNQTGESYTRVHADEVAEGRGVSAWEAVGWIRGGRRGAQLSRRRGLDGRPEGAKGRARRARAQQDVRFGTQPTEERAVTGKEPARRWVTWSFTLHA